MSEKRTRKSKAQHVEVGIQIGLGTREELEALSVPEIKELAIAHYDNPELAVIVDIDNSAGEVLESCEHEWKKVKVIDPKGNHFVNRCLKCGEEVRL